MSTKKNSINEGRKRKSENSDAAGALQPRVKKCSWSGGLKQSMSDHNLSVFRDDLIVVIKDKYPKV